VIAQHRIALRAQDREEAMSDQAGGGGRDLAVGLSSGLGGDGEWRAGI